MSKLNNFIERSKFNKLLNYFTKAKVVDKFSFFTIYLDIKYIL